MYERVLIFSGERAIIYKIYIAVMEIEAQRAKSIFRHAGSSQDPSGEKGAVAEGVQGVSAPGRWENIPSTVAFAESYSYLSGWKVYFVPESILIAGTLDLKYLVCDG